VPGAPALLGDGGHLRLSSSRPAAGNSIRGRRFRRVWHGCAAVSFFISARNAHHAPPVERKTGPAGSLLSRTPRQVPGGRDFNAISVAQTAAGLAPSGQCIPRIHRINATAADVVISSMQKRNVCLPLDMASRSRRAVSTMARSFHCIAIPSHCAQRSRGSSFWCSYGGSSWVSSRKSCGSGSTRRGSAWA
jgi:hypothetical protein